MASPEDTGRLPHDQAFKAIFSRPRMIADAVRGYAVQPRGPLHPRTVAALDWATVDRLPTEWISPDFRRRQGDQVWRVRFREAEDGADPYAHLLILVEFQSDTNPNMALRMAEYTVALQRELVYAGVVKPGAPCPPVLPMVIHNGTQRWTAATELSVVATDAPQVMDDLAPFQLRLAHFALDFDAHRGDDSLPGNAMSVLIGLESARSAAELAAPLGELAGLEDRALARTMADWAVRRLGIVGAEAEEMIAMASLDEFRSQLDERFRGWAEESFEKGVELGRTEGMERGIERGRAEGVKQGMDRGRAEGIERGLAQALAAQRGALRRRAALRFGAEAEVLGPLLERVDAPDKLVEVGEWLIMDTLEELVAKVEAEVAEDHPH